MSKLLSFCITAMLAASTILSVEAAPRHKSLFTPRKFTAQRQFEKAPSTAQATARLVTPEMRQHKSAAMRKATPGGSNIFGYLFYSDDYDLVEGFYDLGEEAPQLMLADPVYDKFGIPMDNGWFADGKICAYNLDLEYDADFGVFPVAFYYSEVDFATGAIIKAKELDLDDGYMQISAYNSNNGCIYGFGYDWMDNFGWLQSSESNPAEFELVKKITDSDDICYSLAYNPIDGNFYGITLAQKFVSITPEGEYTVIAEFDKELYYSEYQCGLVYSAKEQKFYWNPQYQDFTTGLSTVSLDGQVEDIYISNDANQYTYLFTTDEAVAPTLPMTPTVESTDFADGALNGTVTFRLPETLGDGTPLGTSPIDCCATLDGAIYSKGNALPGAAYPVEFKDLATGFHTFGLYVSHNGSDSKAGTVTLFVGIDSPATPANVCLTPTEVTWDAVTEGANGGYINLDELKYEVYLNGELIQTTENTAAQVNIADSEFAVHQATVIAVCGENRSEAGISNKIVDGKPMQLPVFLAPTMAEYELMTAIDANHDGRGWSYSTYSNCIQTTFSKNGQPMDDWIFLPAVALESTDRYYTFGMTTNNLGIDFTEEYAEVKAFLGKPDLSAPSIPVIGKFQVSQKAEQVERFQIETPGTYYIGIHCLSQPDQYGIQVRDIFVRDEQIVAESPAAVTGLKAVAHDNGILKATVTFAFPTENYLGNPLAADTELTATIKGETTSTATGHPGDIVNAVVDTHQGDNTIAVSAFIGENGSPEATCDVYTGVDIPERITNMTLAVAPDMMSAELYWNPPTTGVNGGYVDPALISYEVYRYVEDWYGSGWEKLADCGTGTTYTFHMPQGAAMETVRLGALAINVAGHSGTITYRENVLGTPYTLPLTETFEEPETLDYNPWLIYYADNGVSYGWASLNLIAPEVFPSNTKSALYGRSRYGSTAGSIGLPRFSTAGQPGVMLTIDNYSGQYAAYTRITAQTHDLSTPIIIGELETGDEDFAVTTVKLPDQLLGKEWVQIYLESTFDNSDAMMLATNIEVRGLTDGIQAPISATSITGERGAIRITGHEGDEIAVTTPDGRTVARLRAASADTTIALPAGLYIVRAGTSTAKTIVR